MPKPQEGSKDESVENIEDALAAERDERADEGLQTLEANRKKSAIYRSNSGAG